MKSLILVFLFIIISICNSQSITWQKVYEGPFTQDEGFLDIVGDGLGNSYLLGYEQIQNTSAFWIVKINQYGDTIWTKIFGGYGNGQGAISGVSTTDGGVIFTGGNDTAFTMRLSANGDILWNKKYPLQLGFQYVNLSDIIKTSDGGYIMCGKIFAQTKGCIFKIDSSGNLQWYKVHSAGFQKRYTKIIETDVGYLIDGEADMNQGLTYTVLLKINYNGDTIWERQFRPFTWGFFPSTMFRINNSYWIFGTRNTGLTFVKFDTSGYLTDSISINSPINKHDSFRDALKIHSNNFIITSLRWGPTTSDTDFAEVKKIDSLGNIHASKLITGYAFTELSQSKIETNGDLIFAGYMYYWHRNSGTNPNGYAVRTDSNLSYPPVSIINHSDFIEKNYNLYQNYPNPFNPETVISFDVPEKNNIQITIYNSKGDLVYNLINKSFNTGKYSITWNGTNFPSGIYFINLRVNGKSIKAIKAILLK